MEEVKVTVDKGVKTLEIVRGNLLEPKHKSKLNIEGQITAPALFLAKRKDVINPLQTVVVVDKIKRTIECTIDDIDPLSHKIKGSLSFNPELNEFGINSGTKYTPEELSMFFKMRRSFFESKAIAMKLVSQLAHFKAKVNNEVEQETKSNGSRTQVQIQVVDSNLPEKFELNMPIFGSDIKTKFEVEIIVDPSTLSCSLISPDLKDIIIETRDKIIDDELKDIAKISKNIAILFV